MVRVYLSLVCLCSATIVVGASRQQAHIAPIQVFSPIDGVTTAETGVFLRPNAVVPLRVLPASTTLKVLEQQQEWLQVEFKDEQWGTRVGWIERKFIRVREKTSEVEPTVMGPPTVFPSPSVGRQERGVSTNSAQTPNVAPEAPPTDAPGGGTPTASTKSRKLRNAKIHGYVTSVSTPTNFEIEDYRITSDTDLSLDLNNAGDDVKFALKDLRVGVEVEIAGLLDDSNGELKARSMKVDLDQFRVKPLTAVISYPPRGISQTDAGWTGDFVADGQRIHISPSTKVMFRLSQSDRAIQKSSKQTRNNGADDADVGLEVLHSVDQVTAGMVLTYQGKRDPATGVIQADKVTFMRNDLEPGEAKLWHSLRVQARAAQGLKPGELTIDRVGKFKLLPSDDVQNYVKEIGRTLIPQYQRDLLESDPRKIGFQWFVVEDRTPNAFALANGTVVINSGLFNVLDNEAQLAAVLGHEMAHSTQEHTWRQLQFHKTERMGLAIGAAIASAYGKYNLRDALTLTQAAIQNGYSRSLENQADRVGLEYMTAAGYDPREAPRVWKQMTKEYGNQPTNFFWSSHDNNAVRRSYLMNELRNNYQGVDFASLKLRETEYHRIQQEVRDASSAKMRLKN